MPVTMPTQLTRLSQQEFGAIAFAVMKHVFAIHNEFGRFFDERIYKRELALRMPGLILEMPIDVRHGTFAKRYYLDIVAENGAIFEFKTVDKLVPRHFSQLANYLNLAQVTHGKIINMRPESVEHDFINAPLALSERQAFKIDTHRWNHDVPGAAAFEATAVNLLRDLGTGLDIGLYEEALTQLLGRDPLLLDEVDVLSEGRLLGTQRMRCINDTCAFKITAFTEDQPNFEVHACRLLEHTDLTALFWLNISPNIVALTTLSDSSLLP